MQTRMDFATPPSGHAFQFPPHHWRTLSASQSSYSTLLTPTRFSSSVRAQDAERHHEREDRSQRRVRAVCEAEHLCLCICGSVRKMFCMQRRRGQRHGTREGKSALRTWMRCQAICERIETRTFCGTSPSPASSTPAMLGANHISQVGRRALPAASTSPSTSRAGKPSAYHDIIAIIGGFFPRLFQISFQLLDDLVEGGIIARTLRLDQTLRPEGCVRRV